MMPVPNASKENAFILERLMDASSEKPTLADAPASCAPKSILVSRLCPALATAPLETVSLRMAAEPVTEELQPPPAKRPKAVWLQNACSKSFTRMRSAAMSRLMPVRFWPGDRSTALTGTAVRDPFRLATAKIVKDPGAT